MEVRVARRMVKRWFGPFEGGAGGLSVGGNESHIVEGNAYLFC
jgi:hypothetical protein